MKPEYFKQIYHNLYSVLEFETNRIAEKCKEFFNSFIGTDSELSSACFMLKSLFPYWLFAQEIRFETGFAIDL